MPLVAGNDQATGNHYVANAHVQNVTFQRPYLKGGDHTVAIAVVYQSMGCALGTEDGGARMMDIVGFAARIV